MPAAREPALRLPKGRLALGAAGGDARRTAAETAALRSRHSNGSYESVVHMTRPKGAGEIRILPVAVSGEIRAGESLCARLLAAARSLGLRFQDGDILVVKHKVVSKAEGALVALDEIRPSAASRVWARRYGLDARVCELALRESRRIVRRKRGVLITETEHGFVCANSGVDVSNVDVGGTRRCSR